MLCVCVCARARACARVCVCVCSDMMASLNLRQTILALLIINLISSVSERSVAWISIVRLESKKHNHEMYRLIIKDVQVDNIDV